MNAATRRMTAEAAALDYLGRGWAPIPIKHRCKNPNRRGWQKERHTAETVADVFNCRPQNIGILLGEPSGWLVDVDLDHPKALELAPHFLPATAAKFGRKGNPESHWLYRASAPVRTATHKTSAKASIVELRSTGRQTVFPPSTHESGEPIRWTDPDAEPAKVDPETLTKAVAALADAVRLTLGETHERKADRKQKPKRPYTPDAEHDWTVAESAIKALDPARADSYDDWITVGQALHSKFPDARGRLLWETWSAQSEKYQPGECERKWSGFEVGGGVNLGTLIAMAQEDSPAWRQPPRPRTAPEGPKTAGAGDTSAQNPRETTLVSPSPLSPYRKPPLDVLPEKVRRIVSEVAEAIGCDPAFSLLPCLSVLAAAVGNSRVARVRRDWFVPPVVWTATIGISGTAKSPIYDKLKAPLAKVQDGWFQEYEEEKEAYQLELQTYDAAHADWKSKGRKHGESPPEKPKPPACRRIIADDTTYESLRTLLANNPRGVVLAKDELSGWFGSHNEYKGGKGGDVARWLSMHDARSIITDRQDGAIYIPRAAVCITGGIQPEVLRRCLGRESFENGMAARFLLAYPPWPQRHWTDKEVSEEAESDYERVILGLLDLQPVIDDHGQPAPMAVSFSRRTVEVFKDFVNDNGEIQAQESGVMVSVLSKLESYAVRLALVIQMVRHVSEDGVHGHEITSESLLSAIGLVEWFRDEQRRIYTDVLGSSGEPEMDKLIRIINEFDGVITVRQLMRKCRRYRDSAEDAEAALSRLVRMGIGKWVHIGSGTSARLEFHLFDTR